MSSPLIIHLISGVGFASAAHTKNAVFPFSRVRGAGPFNILGASEKNMLKMFSMALSV